ncbi:Rgg/GadR/MutR family transcriptional regulator [Streptococcus mutans]|uniref:Rgg/GadR/MutR family transcriptional regulator n=1 Tax=Streptococcus mutans TaxID=1309 RepID=UPI0002B54F2C|nr:Rgg/GadR/MutR family transcriptional regulator [Streptococcus mutans]EMB82897.1 putative transcriptional regulator [Streptococcus mutans A9]EMC03640.1 putative transcriptional regulator [Streptococcus mutans NLML5]NLQ32811.1 Rgg/GadR/MutR family transcriptional regulator [Streptococcus mutans]
MTEYGKIFKKFRESRGLKMKEVAGSNLSTSHLSRFENGESELTISKLMTALYEINMPIEEFMYAANDFHQDELNELLKDVRECVNNKDVERLKAVLIKQQENLKEGRIFHHLNVILVKIRLQDLSGETYYSKADLDYLTNYLFKVEYWGFYELLLFTNTIDVFKHETFMVLSREMMRRSDFYKEIPRNRRLISRMALNSFITCIERDKLIDALYFEKQLSICHFDETEIYERLVFHYAQNLFAYKKYKTTFAIIEMKKSVAAMKLAGSLHIAEIYENHLQKILEG